MVIHLKRLIKTNTPILFLIVVFGTVYSLILLINHHNFMSNPEELGRYNNALWDYAHLKFNFILSEKGLPENILAHDFDLYLIIFAPLSFLFGSYTLLIVQIIAILSGGYGIYRYMLLIKASHTLSFFASLHFFVFFGIFSALLHEYQSFAVAAMLIPWFFYYVQKEKLKTAVLIFILMLISNENTSLFVSFICLGMLFNYHKNKRLIIYLIELALIAFAYYLIVTEFIMPYFSNSGKPPQFEHSGVGETYLESIGWIIAHPVLTLKMILFSHINVPGAEYVKIELHVYLLVSGLILLIARPQYILMIIPVYFHKLLSDQHTLWGADALYTAGFAPIITIGLFSYIKTFWSLKARNTWAMIFTVASLVVTIWFMFRPVYPACKHLQVQNKQRYYRIGEMKKIHQYLNKVPDKGIISVPNPLYPNLAYRDSITVFPDIHTANYIVYIKNVDTFTQSGKNYDTLAFELINSEDWEVMVQKGGFYILKRRDKTISP